jgi:hypothetical protein
MNSKDRDKEFSLKDLAQFSTVQDAIDSSISKRVESLMFGGLGDWRKFFVDAMKIDLATLAVNWPALQEVFQRRHVIVHNGGRASRRYIAQMKSLDPGESITEGAVLDCSQEYLEYAIDQLLVAGVLLISAVIVKFSSNSIVTAYLNPLAYSLLREGRWETVKRLCQYGMEMSVDQDSILIFKVNMALAIKAMDGLDGIADEISSWDVSALSDRFKLAKACLMGDLDEAFRLLTLLTDRDELSTEDLVEWPLLSEVRNDRRFTAIISPRLAGPDGLKLLGPEFVILNPRSGTVHKQDCRFAKSGELVSSEAPEVQAARHCKECWK